MERNTKLQVYTVALRAFALVLFALTLPPVVAWGGFMATHGAVVLAAGLAGHEVV